MSASALKGDCPCLSRVSAASRIFSGTVNSSTFGPFTLIPPIKVCHVESSNLLCDSIPQRRDILKGGQRRQMLSGNYARLGRFHSAHCRYDWTSRQKNYVRAAVKGPMTAANGVWARIVAVH